MRLPIPAVRSVESLGPSAKDRSPRLEGPNHAYAGVERAVGRPENESSTVQPRRSPRHPTRPRPAPAGRLAGMSVLTSLRSRVPSSVTARVLTTRNRAMTFAQVRHPVLAGVIIRRLTGGSGSHGPSDGAGGDAAGGGAGAPVADGRRHSGLEQPEGLHPRPAHARGVLRDGTGLRPRRSAQ